MVLGGAVLALLAGDVFAQSGDMAPGAPAKATARSQTPPPKSTSKPTAGAASATTSKITFHSRPSGAKITLSNGKSCIAPCSFIVGFNEKFTAVATKSGYRAKEIDVSPSVTNLGKAQIIGSAIGGGVIGLVVGAAMADRAYGPEPFVAELTPDPTGAAVASRTVKPEGAPSRATVEMPKPAVASKPVPAASQSASAPVATPKPAAAPKPTTAAPQSASAPVTTPKPAAAPKPIPAAPQSASAAPARFSCGQHGCTEIKAGCRAIERSHVASSTAIGGQSSVVVCR
jgi:hypothetical protein